MWQKNYTKTAAKNELKNKFFNKYQIEFFNYNIYPPRLADYSKKFAGIKKNNFAFIFLED